MDDADESFALGCGHRYCLDCWRHHLATSIDVYGLNVLWNVKCQYPQCDIIAGKDVFEMLSDVNTRKKYSYFFKKSFIEGNTEYAYCPSDCGNAIKCKDLTERKDVVVCSCGKNFWYVKQIHIKKNVSA